MAKKPNQPKAPVEKIYWSETTGGFYSSAIHGSIEIVLRDPKTGEVVERRRNLMIPTDAVEITPKQHAELLAAQSDGQRITADVAGAPIAAVPAHRPEDALAALRTRRDRALAASDWTQLPGAPLTAEAREAWARYRAALRDFPTHLVDYPLGAGETIDDLPFPVAPGA